MAGGWGEEKRKLKEEKTLNNLKFVLKSRFSSSSKGFLQHIPQKESHKLLTETLAEVLKFHRKIFNGTGYSEGGWGDELTVELKFAQELEARP